MPCDSVAGKTALIKPPLHAALPRMQWALEDAKRLECGSLLPLCSYAQTTCLALYLRFPALAPQDLQPRQAWKHALRLRRWEERADQAHTARCDAAVAVGVGRREALGVRQLAAALSLCANNVPVPLVGI